jgi:hypothetical protein
LEPRSPFMNKTTWLRPPPTRAASPTIMWRSQSSTRGSREHPIMSTPMCW